jgi:hypothetical protein
MATAPLEGWPNGPGAERDQRVIDAVRSGNYEHEWCPIVLSDGGGQTLTVEVSCDALKVDGVRMNVSAHLQQQVADLIGAVLLTPKLADAIWSKTTGRIAPSPQSITASTRGMVEHSARVDALAAGKSRPLADPGKDWVLVRSIFTASAKAKRKAANYGWHQASGASAAVTPGLRVIQGVGTVHDDLHQDYSQIARFARVAARAGERPVDLRDVYTGKEGSLVDLVSHEGPLPDWRQPGVGGSVPPLVEEPPPPRPPALASAPAPTSIAVPVGLGAVAGAAGYAAWGAQGGFWGALGGLVVGFFASRRS